MNLLDYLLLLLVLSIFLPVLVYVSVKLGVYGFLKGKKQFHEHYPEEEKESRNGIPS